VRIDRHGRGNVGLTLFDLSRAQFRDSRPDEKTTGGDFRVSGKDV
jgi:hypothetical protein